MSPLHRTGRLAVGIVAVIALPAAAQAPSAERQIGWAVAALPERMQADATVLGYRGEDLVVLRRGKGLMMCLADDPAQANHHVACYHKSLDPFMARGRALRAQGLQPEAVDSVRLVEVKSGALVMPTAPTALYQLIARPGNADPETGVVKNANSFYVVYTPYATAESTGLSLSPIKGPWLMDPGMPWAHVMITP